MNIQEDKALAEKFMLAAEIYEVMSPRAKTPDEAEQQLLKAAALIDEYESNKRKVQVRV